MELAIANLLSVTFLLWLADNSLCTTSCAIISGYSKLAEAHKIFIKKYALYCGIILCATKLY